MSYEKEYKTVQKALRSLKVNDSLDHIESTLEYEQLRAGFEKELVNLAEPVKKIADRIMDALFAGMAVREIIDREAGVLPESLALMFVTIMTKFVNIGGQSALNTLEVEKEFKLRNPMVRERVTELLPALRDTSVKNLVKDFKDAFELSLTSSEAWLYTLEGVKQRAKTRSKMIVENESAVFVGRTQFEVFRSAGVDVLEWVTVMDDRVCEICQPMDGQQRPIGNNFKGGDGSLGMYPPIHIGCRCFLDPVQVEGVRLQSIWTGE